MTEGQRIECMIKVMTILINSYRYYRVLAGQQIKKTDIIFVFGHTI